MALWRWNDMEWVKADWQRLSRPDSVVLYGAGESLNDADLVEKGRARFVINRAVEKVEPHIWIGMDKPNIFAENVFNSPFRKILRGSYSKEEIKKKPIKSFPEVYFADNKTQPRSCLWTSRGADIDFFWNKNTMTIALHIILWMGFKEIIFSGIDFKGNYFNKRKPVDQAQTTLLLNQEYDFMKWFAKVAKEQGIKLLNRSPRSRLCDLMETKQ